MDRFSVSSARTAIGNNSDGSAPGAVAQSEMAGLPGALEAAHCLCIGAVARADVHGFAIFLSRRAPLCGRARKVAPCLEGRATSTATMIITICRVGLNIGFVSHPVPLLVPVALQLAGAPWVPLLGGISNGR
jgi:hypothetical protein